MKKGLIILLLGMLAFLHAPDVVASDADDVKKELYAQINEYRISHGLEALSIDNSIEASSAVYAFKLTTFYGSKVRHDISWLNRQNKACAELIGGRTDTFRWWTRSYTHNSKLLGKRFTRMGIGIVGGNYVLRLKE